MTEEEWVKAAAVNDSIVAELLLSLNQVAAPSPPKPKPSLALGWSVRQRRSNAKKPAPRASPTTPLSWSAGATSVSGGAVDGGSDESPPSKLPGTTRSKVNGTSESIASKRSRRKKSLTQLKEEEMLLIIERKQLKRELALLRASLEYQRDTNQNYLKKMKLDLQCQQANDLGGISVTYDGISPQPQLDLSPRKPALPISLENVAGKAALAPSSLENGCSEEQKELEAEESRFVIPDLNLPFDTEILCG